MYSQKKTLTCHRFLHCFLFYKYIIYENKINEWHWSNMTNSYRHGAYFFIACQQFTDNRHVQKKCKTASFHWERRYQTSQTCHFLFKFLYQARRRSGHVYVICVRGVSILPVFVIFQFDFWNCSGIVHFISVIITTNLTEITVCR